ncbi:putative ribonuclease H-like domain-containing protein [Tanacetum coccineum]
MPRVESVGPVELSLKIGKNTGGQREIRPVWNNTQRINHQNKFVPSVVLTRSGRVPVSAAKQSSYRAATSTGAVKQVNTAPNTRILNEKVNTVRVNGVNTAGQTEVNAVKGNGVNPQQALKNKGIFDSGCSMHMTGNKDFLTDHQDIDGCFVAFGGSARGGKISGKGKIRTDKLDFEDVFFVKELKFNLFSVSQMCDKKNNVLFTKTECLVLCPDFKLLDESQVLLRVPKQSNMYSFNLKNVVPYGDLTCLYAKSTIEESKLWHRRLGHVNFKTMNKLVKGNLVRGLPSKNFDNDHTCVACQKGKQHKASCKAKLISSISQPLQMLHMDLFGPTSGRSINHKAYCLIVTNDFSRFSWVFFLAFKDETSEILKRFITKIENQLNHKVKVIRCDNGTEFKNREINEFWNQTNKNAGPQEANGDTGLKKSVEKSEEKRMCLLNNIVWFPLWSSISSSYKSSDETYKNDTADDAAGETPVQKPASENEQALKNVLDKMIDQEKEATEQSDAVRKEFEAQCNRELLQGKATKASSTNSFNTISTPVNVASTPRTSNDVEPSSVSLGGSFPLNVNDLPDDPLMPDLEDTAKADFNNMEPSTITSPIPTTRIHSIHPKNQIIGDPKSAVEIRGMSKKSSREHAMISYIQKQKRTNHKWLKQCKKSAFSLRFRKVWTLSGLPYGKKAIGTKWVYRNKKDERGIVVRNKAKLVAQGYKQEEGIDYDEVFAPVARIEAIRLFLAYASFMNFLVYRWMLTVSFSMGNLLGLRRAWYETLSTYLLDNGFYRGQIDKTLFTKRVNGDILLVQVSVDYIIFGSTKKSLCTDFEQIMHKRFQMSSMGELTFFLGLQVKQKEDGIFISQDKYVGEILKKFGFSSIRTTSTPMETNKALTKDEDGKDVDVHLYRSMIGSLMYLTSCRPDIMFSVCACLRFQLQPKDSPFILEAFPESDYAGASLDRKSTTGGGGDSVERAITNQLLAASLDAAHDSDNIIRTQTTTRSERVLEQPIEPPLSKGHTSGSGEGSMEHQFELTANVLDLKKKKNAQAVEILRLKKRVKGLERQRKSSTSQPRRRKYRPTGPMLCQLLKWNFHENYGVHTLFMDGTPMEINMLVEKKYPLIKELLEKMLNLQLEAEEESTMAFELIKFIKSMLEE